MEVENKQNNNNIPNNDNPELKLKNSPKKTPTKKKIQAVIGQKILEILF